MYINIGNQRGIYGRGEGRKLGDSTPSPEERTFDDQLFCSLISFWTIKIQQLLKWWLFVICCRFSHFQGKLQGNSKNDLKSISDLKSCGIKFTVYSFNLKLGKHERKKQQNIFLAKFRIWKQIIGLFSIFFFFLKPNISPCSH